MKKMIVSNQTFVKKINADLIKVDRNFDDLF